MTNPKPSIRITVDLTTYRRILEIQTRLLARYITGEIHDYPPFITR